MRPVTGYSSLSLAKRGSDTSIDLSKKGDISITLCPNTLSPLKQTSWCIYFEKTTAQKLL